jgi:large conductance mechanosensitive channel
MQRFSAELKAGSFWSMAFAVAVALTTFQVTLNLISNVLYPVIHSLTSLNLSQLSIDLTKARTPFGPDSYLDTVRFGPSLALLLAGLTTVIVLAQAYRWSLNAAAAGSVECPYCLSAIPLEASRCAYCGADQSEQDEQSPDET